MSEQEIPSSSPLSLVHSEPDFPRTLAEQRLESYQPVDEHDTTQKLLSIFIQELPEEGAINICNDIDGCTSDEEIHQLAAHLFESIMKPMKGRPKSPSPILSPRLGAFESIDRMVAELPESNSQVQQSKLRKNCLLRDNNKCVVSGFYDTYEFEKLPDKQKGEMIMTGKCEAAHIFPFCLGKYSDTELSATCIIWESLYRCFPLIQPHAGLSVDSINATFNALILYAPLHEEFGNFKLAFEPTAEANTYKIRTYHPFSRASARDLPADGHVTFIAHHGEYELPAPSLLQAHAALAKILHATGMGEYIEKVLREREELIGFAENSTTDLRRLLLVF